MKVLSLYCGGGGIDQGLKKAGIKTTLAIDIEKDMIETMKINHPGIETIVGKVGDYVESFNGFDIIVGGPPCPEFSRANINRTFNMCEVNNFWKIVEKIKPKYYIMENVEDMNLKLFKQNYLINSADYGVPQIRWRRFFTNLQRPETTHAENPGINLFGNIQKKWVSVKEALGFEGMIEDRKSVFDGEKRDRSVDRPCFTLVTDCRVWLVTDLEKAHPEQFVRHPMSNINNPAYTVLAKDYGMPSGEDITDGKYARKLTNEELKILMGFPKKYKFFGNKGSVRKQIGNAVCPPIITAFFKGVKE